MSMHHQNTLRQEKISHKGFQSVSNFIQWVEAWVGCFVRVFPTKYLSKTLFSVTLVLMYIGNRHHVSQLVRQIEHTKTQVENLQAEYMHVKMAYTKEISHKSLLKKARKLGLKETQDPPQVVSE